jgi:hypothetical protein
MNPRDSNTCGKFMLWIDAVGGYWVCLAERVVLGQPAPGGDGPDVPILADLSSRHACIRRDGEGHLIEALRPVRVDGRPVQAVTWLGDGGRIELGEGVQLLFRRPHPLSATARLDFVSPHRTQPSSDGVLLMADVCVLGPKAHSHVVCRNWSREVMLFRHGEQLYCRTPGRFEIDGLACRDRGRLTWDSRVTGEGFSLKLETMRS